MDGGIEQTLPPALRGLPVALVFLDFRDETRASRLPSFSHPPESIGEHRDFQEHGSEALDQRQKPWLWHGRDQVVQHAALTEQ